MDKRDTGGKIAITVPFANSEGTGRENAPDAREQRGVPRPLMVLQSEDRRGPRPKVALPRDTIYITNVEPQVVIAMAGHLIEFPIDTGATFSVLTQRIGNLSNHKKYVMGLSGKR